MAREAQAFLHVIDTRNTESLKEILQAHEWVNISAFGADADKHAFLIVQHADHDRVFQRETLQKLEKLCPLGETVSTNVAYLHDRLSVHVFKTPQRYGTQGVQDAQGRWSPFPCEDPAGLEARRAAMGLEPMAQYQERCSLPQAKVAAAGKPASIAL